MIKPTYSRNDKIEIIVSSLLRGGYMRKVFAYSGAINYRVYDAKGIIQAAFAEATVDKLLARYNPPICKVLHNGKVIIVRRSLQQAHGKSIAKKCYKKFIKSKHN